LLYLAVVGTLWSRRWQFSTLLTKKLWAIF
jgi:hypothetical protein